MCPERAFIRKKDRTHAKQFFSVFSIRAKPLKRLPKGKLNDLTFQELLGALENFEFIISGRDLDADIWVFINPKAGR
jgi:hypothetical protein